MFHNGNENSDMSAPERTPFYQLRLENKDIISHLLPTFKLYNVKSKPFLP